ncbi:hypothetical protein [Blastomonas sp.]|uniref:Gldg family protein n=1 Tax=Blastomonas sp. TaxID=1909299 RepID=UPI0026023623|nr:hypothetical protein [Blastomonas sp.]MDM7955060.1 hypothetical protein [Blastomonas sp.]
MISRTLAACLAVALATGCSAAPSAEADSPQPAPEAAPLVPDMPRMRVVLMSSLPLVHGDGVDMTAMLAGQSNPHPLHEELNAAHDLVVADALADETLAGADLVILVQPRMLPPEALVALDGYVRRGGRLLLFTDPVLDWPGGKGLGDPLGPQRTGLLSPLLAHWGLVLVDPVIESVRLQPSGALLAHPGVFTPAPGKIGDVACRIEREGHVAHCQPGEGRAILVGDADVLDPALISQSADSGRANRRFVSVLISDLMRKDTS